ncbi:hypothetical protein NX059_011945 [Plenodomus lindquistii]|nr:hypothetical protein NX059_011945 [Plenodomus lindquistii]
MVQVMLERADDTEQHIPSSRLSQSKQLGVATSPSDAQQHEHSGSSTRKTSRRLTSSMGGPNMPLTPSHTASSVKSRGSRSGRAAAKYILIASDIEGGNEDEKVHFEVAPIPQSVIRESVVNDLGLAGRVDDADLECVRIPSHAAPSGYREIPVEDAVILTWSYLGAKTSRRTKFYVIAGGTLEIDVILSHNDVDQPSSEQGLRLDTQYPQQPLQHDHYDRSPQAHHQLSGSYHPSDYTVDRLMNSMPTRSGPDRHEHQNAQRFVQEVMGGGRTMPDKGKASQQPSTQTIPVRAHESHETHQPDRSKSDPTGTLNDPNAADGKIRVQIDWGRTPSLVWLDMCAPSEAFLQTFQKLSEKKKQRFEGVEVSLFLKQDKLSSDDDEYEMNLGADELDADWEATLEWLRENKRNKAPHIYARVEVGDG